MPKNKQLRDSIFVIGSVLIFTGLVLALIGDMVCVPFLAIGAIGLWVILITPYLSKPASKK